MGNINSDMNDLMDELLDGGSASSIQDTLNKINNNMNAEMEDMDEDMLFGYGSQPAPPTSGYGEVEDEMKKAATDLDDGHVNAAMNEMQDAAITSEDNLLGSTPTPSPTTSATNSSTTPAATTSPAPPSVHTTVSAAAADAARVDSSTSDTVNCTDMKGPRCTAIIAAKTCSNWWAASVCKKSCNLCTGASAPTSAPSSPRYEGWHIVAVLGILLVLGGAAAWFVVARMNSRPAAPMEVVHLAKPVQYSQVPQPLPNSPSRVQVTGV